MRIKEVLKALDERIDNWEHESRNTHYVGLDEDDIALIREALEIIRSDYEY